MRMQREKWDVLVVLAVDTGKVAWYEILTRRALYFHLDPMLGEKVLRNLDAMASQKTVQPD